jgi:hypothetical protein
VAKRRKGRYPNEFRRMAVARLKRCENSVALSEELGVHRRLLYKWRDQLDPIDIAAAGLDVYESEPNIHPAYRSLPNTFLLPHLGTAKAAPKNREE